MPHFKSELKKLSNSYSVNIPKYYSYVPRKGLRCQQIKERVEMSTDKERVEISTDKERVEMSSTDLTPPYFLNSSNQELDSPNQELNSPNQELNFQRNISWSFLCSMI
jgi:hypothetical protein